MPSEKYTEAYLTERFPVEVRETLRADDLNPTHLPSYEYLNANGFGTRGLNKALERHFEDGRTVHDHLRKHGFDVPHTGEWPCEHDETVRHLDLFVKSRRKRYESPEKSIDTLKSALRKILRISQKVNKTDDLISYGRETDSMSKFERNEQMRAILDHLKDIQDDRTARSYTGYLSDFYDVVASNTDLDFNPVQNVRDEYRFITRSSDPQPLDDDQIEQLWDTLLRLGQSPAPKQRASCKSVRDLLTRHGTDWIIQMMVLIVVGVGIGLRPGECARLHTDQHLKLDDDPHVTFDQRKNLPGTVPILTRCDFIEAYIEYMEATQDSWNRYLFLSTDSESGHRVPETLNNWLEAICRESDVRLDDGSYPTLQNLRQTWHTKYKHTLQKHRVQMQLVADEAGTETSDIVDESYVPDIEDAKTIREFARKDFDDVLPLTEGIPDFMRPDKSSDQQRELDSF